MPKYIEENGEVFILYDNCEEYVYLGNNPGYKSGTFVDVELEKCCGGNIIRQIPTTPTPTISVTPTVTSTPTPTINQTQTPTETPKPTPTPTQTLTQTPSITPTHTPSITPTSSVTPTITVSLSVTASVTPSISVTPTVSITPSCTPTVTPTSLISNNEDAPNVEIIDLHDDEGNLYEVVSLDVGIPTNISKPYNNKIVAIAAPVSDYRHRISSNKPDLNSLVGLRNILISTDTYFVDYDSQNQINVNPNNKFWQYPHYPAGRISSVSFNKILNRWFFGTQSLADETNVILYGHNNGGLEVTDQLNMHFDILEKDSFDGMICGPTKIYSMDNKLVLANNQYVYIYITNDKFANNLAYNYKGLVYTCKDTENNTDCGININDVPTNTTITKQHMPIIGNCNVLNKIKILHNPSNNDIELDSADIDCSSVSSDKGYFISSYEFDIAVAVLEISTQIYPKEIRIVFSEYVNFDLQSDVSIVSLKGDNIDNTKWNIQRNSDDAYSLFISDEATFEKITNYSYYMKINLDNSQNQENINIPKEINIPLQNVAEGIFLSNTEFKDNRPTPYSENKSIIPVFMTNGGYFINKTDTETEFYIQSSDDCDCGYTYKIFNDRIGEKTLCLSDLSGLYSDSEIKAVASYGIDTYIIVQHHKDPENPTNGQVFSYSLYKASLLDPDFTFKMIIDDLKVYRRLDNLRGRELCNNWSNSVVIDENYLIIGVPNSSKIIKIDHNNIDIIDNSP